MKQIKQIETKKEEFMRVPEIANILNVKRQTIYRWIKRGYIPACKIGKTFVIPWNEFLEAMQKMHFKPNE